MQSFSQSTNHSQQIPSPLRPTVDYDMTHWPEETRNQMLASRDEFQGIARELGLRPPLIYEDVAEMFLWAGYDGPDTVN
jgi:hypothetical protein